MQFFFDQFRSIITLMAIACMMGNGIGLAAVAIYLTVKLGWVGFLDMSLRDSVIRKQDMVVFKVLQLVRVAESHKALNQQLEAQDLERNIRIFCP